MFNLEESDRAGKINSPACTEAPAADGDHLIYFHTSPPIRSRASHEFWPLPVGYSPASHTDLRSRDGERANCLCRLDWQHARRPQGQLSRARAAWTGVNCLFPVAELALLFALLNSDSNSGSKCWGQTRQRLSGREMRVRQRSERRAKNEPNRICEPQRGSI